MAEGLQMSIKIINLDKMFVIHIIHLYGKLAIILNPLKFFEAHMNEFM